MRSQTNRKAIIISALVTAFALTLVTGGLLLSNRLSASATAPAQKPAATTAPLAQPAADSASLAAQPADSAAVTAAYEAQLQAAYQALQDAYAQINALQAAQNQPVTNFAPGFEHEHDHEGDHD